MIPPFSTTASAPVRTISHYSTKYPNDVEYVSTNSRIEYDLTGEPLLLELLKCLNSL